MRRDGYETRGIVHKAKRILKIVITVDFHSKERDSVRERERLFNISHKKNIKIIMICTLQL